MNESEDLKICRQATPGPWTYTYDGSSDYSIGPDDPQVNPVASVHTKDPDAPNAVFIAHFNPAYVEKLILERDRYREALEKYADPNSDHYIERHVPQDPPKTSYVVFKSVLEITKLARKALERE